MKSIVQRALGWLRGKEEPAAQAGSPEASDPNLDKTRHFLRAAARMIVLAAAADGSQSEDEMIAARLAAKPIQSLAALKETAFQALIKEASLKHKHEGEEASLQFIASQVTEAEDKAKIFSIAVAVTFADREIKDTEKQFLEKLRAVLQIQEEDAQAIQHSLEELRATQGPV